MFEGRTILIVEDEPLIGLELACAIEDRGGTVIGPVDTVAEGMTLAGQRALSAAILDANLSDCDVTQLALDLLARGTPFVIYTGTGLPDALARIHPDIPVVMKPAQMRAVLGALDARLP